MKQQILQAENEQLKHDKAVLEIALYNACDKIKSIYCSDYCADCVVKRGKMCNYFEQYNYKKFIKQAEDEKCLYCDKKCHDIRFTEECPRPFYCDGNKISTALVNNDIAELRKGYCIVTGLSDTDLTDEEIKIYIWQRYKMKTPRIIRCSAKADINGHFFECEVDIANETIQSGYGLFYASSDDIKLSRKEINKLVKAYAWLGYKEI